MNYSNIISDFTWSYSRIKQFEMCPYGFLLRYIKMVPRKNLFFSDYGTFIHKIIEKYLRGELDRKSLYSYYLANFRQSVTGRAPNRDIFKTYFEQGLRYMADINFPYPHPAAVEERVDFSIEDKAFTGIIDCVAVDNGGVIILDNKSRVLKPRSSKSRPTKSDIELDSYLRQLYIYSIPVREQYGSDPVRLEFNCFRSGDIISEKFLPAGSKAVGARFHRRDHQ